MRFITWACSTGLYAQTFVAMPAPAPALAMGSAGGASLSLRMATANDAAPATHRQHGLYASTALPYGLTDWRTAHAHGVAPLGQQGALSFRLATTGVEAYREQQVSAGYARKLSDKLLLGMRASLVRADAREYGTAHALTGSLGVLASPLPNVWMGSQLDNPLRQTLAGTALPSTLRIGAAWHPSVGFSMQAEVFKEVERGAELRAGAHYKPAERVDLRAGMRTNPGRPTLGAGVTVRDRLHIDFGAEWHPRLGTTTGLMIAWQ
jgi:hypothetical protein